MNDPLVNELRILRDACAVTREEKGLDASPLDDVILKLNTMIVERTEKAELENSRRARVGALGYADRHSNRMTAEGQKAAPQILAEDYAYWVRLADAATEEASNAAKREVGTADPAMCEALGAYLRQSFAGEDGLIVTDLQVMTAGYSKKTYLALLEGQASLPAELIIRADQTASYIPTTVKDEYDLLVMLDENDVPVPHPLILEVTGSVIGNPFIIVSKVPGRTIGDPYTAPPADIELTRSTAAAMVAIHAVPLALLEEGGLSYDKANSPIVADFAKYDAMWKEMNVYNPTLDIAFEWVRENFDAADGRLTLVHNDFSYNNILVENGRVAAVLDWEFAHIGNPAADLAYHRYVADQMSGFDTFKTCYTEAGGLLPSDREIDFYYIWGMTRLGVLIHQAQDVFDSGANLDLRFAVAGARYMRHPMRAIGKRLGEILRTA